MVEYISIKVTKSIHDRLVKDKKEFTEIIGLHFSMSDTINELYKILDCYTPKIKEEKDKI